VSQTRLTLNGLRHYNCAGVPKPLPSVTSVLSATQSEDTRKKLAHWNIMNPGVLENAAARGTFIHNAVENWIRGLRVEPPREYLPYWDGMPAKLEELLSEGKVLWSEKPYNQPQWSRYTGEDGVGRIHYYDEVTGYGYAGCCDIIYVDGNGEIILGDFKTSAGPYSYRFPRADSGLDDKTRKALISGVFKLKKTQLQLAAYKIAAESCLGIKIDKTQIIVSTPSPDYSVQVFTFGKNDIEKHEAQWMEVIKQFYDLQKTA
jgi:hypothetical protein